MIAAVCGWHEHHEPVLAEVAARLKSGEELVSAAPALVEFYAVTTRLPPPHRLSPSDSLALLEANFVHGRRIISLDSRAYLAVLRGAPTREVSGGRTYDAIIAECASRARVTALLTFDEEDFHPWTGTTFEVVVPRHRN